ncbi:olfactory receptor 1019-like [Spea bombifrons]|uniref:olfactory receptor 1019-like n=1 Tax=Spea bombifrons TaxID=233779 RepID=UPI00234BE310|nr:olfactory receptor 1019-like [Spea bombifrons]
MFFFAIFGTSGVYLLAAMAYDRYVAIHFPLRYSLFMNKQMCFWLVFSCYVMSLIQSSAVISSISQLCFCASRNINHYFCDIPPLLKLACSNTTLTEILVYIFGGFVEAGSLAVIFASYSLILLSVLRIRSSKGRYKAFSTCGSHFTCVTLFYGTVVFTYMRPTSNYSKGQEWLISIVYTTVIPAANPMIYSLRNSEVKGALKKLMFGTISYNK